MKFLCLTNPSEKPNRHQAARDYFSSIGLDPVYLNCLYGPISGIITRHKWGKFGVEQISDIKTGIWLAHYMAWNAAWAMGDEAVCIMEDDAKFVGDWQNDVTLTLHHAGGGFDVIRLSSSMPDMDRATPVGERLWQCPSVYSMVAYIVRRRAIPVLLETQRKCCGPMDHSILESTYHNLNMCNCIPAIVEQDNHRWELC